MPSRDTVAQRLHPAPPPRREHTSYRALTNETREAFAIEPLTNTGLTVAEVADRSTLRVGAGAFLLDVVAPTHESYGRVHEHLVVTLVGNTDPGTDDAEPSRLPTSA
jgi:hypothetical protein